jgi:hypothetical protein
MPVNFSGTLLAGQYQDFATTGWPLEFFVQWSVRPSYNYTGAVALRALAVEQGDDMTLTYVLTVWNIGQESVQFDALYSNTTYGQTVIDDGHGAYSLDAGDTLDITWDFGVSPTLLTIIARPTEDSSTLAVFECSTPSIQLKPDGTGTYAFNVTNTGSDTGYFQLRAMLS